VVVIAARVEFLLEWESQGVLARTNSPDWDRLEVSIWDHITGRRVHIVRTKGAGPLVQEHLCPRLSLAENYNRVELGSDFSNGAASATTLILTYVIVAWSRIGIRDSKDLTNLAGIGHKDGNSSRVLALVNPALVGFIWVSVVSGTRHELVANLFSRKSGGASMHDPARCLILLQLLVLQKVQVIRSGANTTRFHVPNVTESFEDEGRETIDGLHVVQFLAPNCARPATMESIRDVLCWEMVTRSSVGPLEHVKFPTHWQIQLCGGLVCLLDSYRVGSDGTEVLEICRQFIFLPCEVWIRVFLIFLSILRNSEQSSFVISFSHAACCCYCTIRVSLVLVNQLEEVWEDQLRIHGRTRNHFG